MEHNKLRIDPEFRDKIPPLMDSEYEQLRENILAEGEVYEPIIVWNGVIVDGHNRWRIIQENPDITYRIKEMNFPDKWAAFDWMYKNQLGRRNLTDEQRTLLLGKMYEARKKSVGNPSSRDSKGKFQLRQNDAIGLGRSGRTSISIAKEMGVGQAAVERAAKFAKGIDALSEVSKEAADKVLSGNSLATKAEIREFPKMAQEQKQEVVSSILSGSKPRKSNNSSEPSKSNNPAGYSKSDRKLKADISAIVASMKGNTEEIVYSMDDLTADIRVNAESYVDMLRRTMEQHIKVYSGCDAKKEVILKVLTESITEEIEKIKREIKNA